MGSTSIIEWGEEFGLYNSGPLRQEKRTGKKETTGTGSQTLESERSGYKLDLLPSSVQMSSQNILLEGKLVN